METTAPQPSEAGAGLRTLYDAAMLRLIPVVLISTVFALAAHAAADDSDQRWTFDNGKLRVQASPRTPQQIAAFYIGRKFPPEMVDTLRQHCFITFGIRNQSDSIIWLDQSQWRFESEGQVLEPLDRSYWKSKWQEMDAPLPAQSTFRWTLLPPRLDFRPGEAEGGNVVLPRVKGPIRWTARFQPENDGGEAIEVRFEDLRCATDPAS